MPFSILTFERRPLLVDAAGDHESPVGEDVCLPQQPRVGDGGCQSACACGVFGRLGVAHDSAEHVEAHERLEAEDIVVEVVGNFQYGTRTIEGGWEAFPEALCPAEADLDERLERRVCRGIAQGFLEDRDGKIVMLELGEEEERLGAERAGLSLGQQVGRDRSRTGPLPGNEMGTGSGERAPAALVTLDRRRQAKRLLGELGHYRRLAAIRCQRGGVIEQTRNVGIRAVSREREVTGAQDRAVDDLRDAPVNAAPLLAEIAVENRGQQGMGEADRPVRALDDMRGDCRFERV